MDASYREIPWLNEDQGEGVKDPIEDLNEFTKQIEESMKQLDTFQEFMGKLRQPWKRG